MRAILSNRGPDIFTVKEHTKGQFGENAPSFLVDSITFRYPLFGYSNSPLVLDLFGQIGDNRTTFFVTVPKTKGTDSKSVPSVVQIC